MTIKSKYFQLMTTLCLATFLCSAQEYKVQALLAVVPTTGFYRIPVTPELSAYAKDDLSDIRIVEGSTFIPYINQKETVTDAPDSFIAFPILSNTTKGHTTTIIVKNPLTNINTLSFKMNNTAEERYVSLSGSDDNEHWFEVIYHRHFDKSYKDDDGTYIQTVFPYNKYSYYKLSIDNGRSDPVKITDAGIFKNGDITTAVYYPNPDPETVAQRDSNGITYVLIRNPFPFRTDKIELSISGPALYHRNATASVMHNGPYAGQTSVDFIISSDSPASCLLPAQKAYNILLQIVNEDNPSLHVSGARTYYEPQYLIAWLEQGKNYLVLAGNPDARAPRYDLGYFKNNIPQNTPLLLYDKPALIPKGAAQPHEKTTSSYYSNVWLWPVIVIAVIVLSLLTYKLMKEARQHN